MKENGTNAISVGFPINPYLRELRSKESPFKENIFDCFASNPLGSYFFENIGKVTTAGSFDKLHRVLWY